MRGSLVFCITIAILLAGSVAAECPRAKQARTEQALVELEQRWAGALEQHDAAAVACLLAPEFVDSTPDGQVQDRAAVLAAVPKRRAASNRLEQLQVTLAGETAVVHGLNHVLDPTGKELAVVRFTDTFVHRDGQWQAVAGHESLVRTPQQEAARLKTMEPMEITPEEVKRQRDQGEKFLLLDVREPGELEKAHVADARNIPMGDVPSRLTELDPDARIVVMCHLGVRSLKVTNWLRQQGFEHVQSMRGGIDSWARQVDPKVPVY